MKKIHSKTLICIIALVCSLSAQAQYVWTQKANFPGNARTAAACFSIGNYVYVGNGGAGSTYYNDWWRWNKSTNTWIQIASYPGAGKYGCTYFAVGGKGYVGLGTNGTCQTDFWSYDTATNTWTQMATFPARGRYSALAFIIGKEAYLPTGNPGGTPYLTDGWKYNTVTNTWTSIANYPLANNQQTFLYSIGKYGYAGTGGDGSSVIDSMFQYDTTTNSYGSIAHIPVPGNGLDCPTGFVLKDTAYCISGRNSSGNSIYDMFSYNPSTNTWATLAAFPGAAFWYGVGCNIGDYGYVTTGTDSIGGYLNQFWQFGPSNTDGINNLKNNNLNVNVYPNPSKGLINFTYSDLTRGNSQLVITDVLGSTISAYTLNGTQGKLSVDESQLSNGVYFYQLNSNGVVLTTGKLLIER